MEAGDPGISLDLIARALDAMAVSVHATVDSERDPLADPLLEETDRALLSRELLKRQIARRIAERHGVDADDVRHVLTNLERPPLARLAHAFRRARLRRHAVH